MKLTQEEVENLNRAIRSMEIDSLIKKKKIPQKESQSQMASLVNSSKFLKNSTSFSQVFLKNKRGENAFQPILIQVLPWYQMQTKTSHTQKKLQTTIPYEHRSKILN